MGAPYRIQVRRGDYRRPGGGIETGSSGFVSFHALVIMVFATLAGAWLLKSAAKESGTAGSYFHKRSSVTAARAGLAAAVSELESDTAQAMALLAGYVKDPSRQWLLGPASGAASPRMRTLPTGQTFNARILSFDTATSLIKIQSEGGGPGGSITRITGLYRLDGLGGPEVRENTVYAFYLAGSGHTLQAPIHVEGPTYMGGGFLLQPGAAGTRFDGPFKAAADASGLPASLQGSARFGGSAWFECPVRVQAPQDFHGLAGFDDEVVLDMAASLRGGGIGAFANGGFTGARQLDLGGNPFAHSGFVPSGRIANASSVRVLQKGESAASAMGVSYGPEPALRMDFSSLAPNQFTYPAEIGLTDAFTSQDLEDAYHRTPKARRFGPMNKWQVVVVDHPMSLVRGPTPADDENYKCVIFLVRSTLTIGGNLWKTTVCDWGDFTSMEGNALFVVQAGGHLVGMGGDHRFRGYVRAENGGVVTYQWGPGGFQAGAVHHVDPSAGIGITGPNPFHIKLDQPTLDDMYTTGLFRLPPAPAPLPPAPRLVDVRIRPRLLGMYY